jgi:hypothetical protein
VFFVGAIRSSEVNAHVANITAMERFGAGYSPPLIMINHPSASPELILGPKEGKSSLPPF